MNNKYYIVVFIILFSFLVYQNLFFKEQDINNIIIQDNISENIKNTPEIDLFCLNNIDFNLESSCKTESKIKFFLTNKNLDLLGFLVIVFNENSEESYIINQKLKKDEKKELYIEPENMKNIKKINIFPVIKFNKDLVLCKNSMTYTSIPLCKNICEDNTLYTKCSKNKPYFCDNGNLIENCKLCGCNSGDYCYNYTCTSCKEAWVCSEWSDCINGIQKKGCFDLNECNTFFNKPIDERKC